MVLVNGVSRPREGTSTNDVCQTCLCPAVGWAQVTTSVDASPLPSVEASSGELFMGSEANGMILTVSHFSLRPKLYFDSALPGNVRQQVRKETLIPSLQKSMLMPSPSFVGAVSCHSALSQCRSTACTPCIDASPSLSVRHHVTVLHASLPPHPP